MTHNCIGGVAMDSDEKRPLLAGIVGEFSAALRLTALTMVIVALASAMAWGVVAWTKWQFGQGITSGLRDEQQGQ